MVMNAPCVNDRCEKKAQSERGSAINWNEVESKISTVQGKLCVQKQIDIFKKEKASCLHHLLSGKQNL